MTLRGSVSRLIIAVAAWSLSPLLIVRTVGLTSNSVLTALLAVSIAAIVACILSAFSGTYRLNVAFRAVREGKLLRQAIFVGLGAFVLYPLLYFSAIQYGPAVLVNLVNYLWPIIGLAFVAVVRPAQRSLELGLAAAFGFAGATLAILTNGSDGIDGLTALFGFGLALLGALTYGAVSAYMGSRRNPVLKDSLRLLLVALAIGGGVAITLISSLLLLGQSLLSDGATSSNWISLAIYALLLPLAHFTWLSAVQDTRIPSFAAVFLVPILATTLLSFYVGDETTSGSILSALVLVLGGVAFATFSDDGVPVALSVTLAFVASVLVSQTLSTTAVTLDAEALGFGAVLVQLVAIFAGFVLSNAIRRYQDLLTACKNLYQSLTVEVRGGDPVATADLDELDRLILDRHYGLSIHEATAIDNLNQMIPVAKMHDGVWADMDAALAGGISRYEWLVLVIGSSGLVVTIHLFAIGSSSLWTMIMRAFAAAITVGILFAIRDYDRNRPSRSIGFLVQLRRRFGLSIDPLSSLGVEIAAAAHPPLWGRNLFAAVVCLGIVAIAYHAVLFA